MRLKTSIVKSDWLNKLILVHKTFESLGQVYFRDAALDDVKIIMEIFEIGLAEFIASLAWKSLTVKGFVELYLGSTQNLRY